MISEIIKDLNKQVTTTNRYFVNGTLKSVSNINSQYGLPVGTEKEFDETGILKSEKDWEKGVEFSLQDLLKTYRKKITNYLEKNKDSIGSESRVCNEKPSWK